MKGARMDTRGAGILRDLYGALFDRTETFLREKGFNGAHEYRRVRIRLPNGRRS